MQIGLGLTLAPYRSAVSAAFTPASVPGLVAAWDWSDTSKFTQTGGSIDTVAGAYGTSTPLTLISGGAKTTRADNEVKGQTIAIAAGAAKGMTFAAKTLSGDFDIWVAAGDAVASATPLSLLGKDTNNAARFSYARGTGTTNSSYIVRGGGSAYSPSLGFQATPGVHVHRLSRRGSTWTIKLDKETVATIAGDTASMVLDAVGWNASGNFFNGGFGAVLIHDGTVAALSAGNATAIDDFLEAKWRSGPFVSQSSGNDANAGWNEARAVQNISKLNGKGLRERSVTALKRGDVWSQGLYGDGTGAWNGTTSGRVTIQAYGTGANPRIEALDLVTGTWADQGGGIYRIAKAATFTISDGANAGVVQVVDGASTYRLWSSESTALNEQADRMWFHDGTYLYVKIGKDPTSCTVSLSHAGLVTVGVTDAAIRCADSFVDFIDIDVGPWPGNGVRFSGPTCHYKGSALGTKITHPLTGHYPTWSGAPTVYWVAGDCYNLGGGDDTSTATVQRITNANLIAPGLRFGRGGSAGDNLTGHGADFIATNVICHEATKGSICSLPGTKNICYNVEAYGGYKPVYMAGTDAAGSVELYGCYIERAANAGQDDAVVIDPPISSIYAVIAQNTTFVGLGTVRGKVFNPGSATLTQSGNTQTGFNSLT